MVHGYLWEHRLSAQHLQNMAILKEEGPGWKSIAGAFKSMSRFD